MIVPNKAVIQKKSEWQKDDCLFCSRESTLEVCGFDTQLGPAYLRFCGQLQCLLTMLTVFEIANWDITPLEYVEFRSMKKADTDDSVVDISQFKVLGDEVF